MTTRTRTVILAVVLTLAAAARPAVAGPNPHAALDCNYCHLDTPIFGVDTRETVNFWRAEGDEPQLCERCHTPDQNFHPLGVVPGPDHLGTQRPEHLPLGKSEAVRDQIVCTTCHFIHAATDDTALLRGFPGSDQPSLFKGEWQSLCRECHGTTLLKRSPHSGDERSCAFCHSVKPRPGQPAALTPVGRALCYSCHGPHGKDHYAGVNAKPGAQEHDCVACHDPHLGQDHPARLRAGYFDPIRDTVTLNPHRRRTLCFACHVEGASGALRATSAVALCQRCHDSGKIPGMSHPMSKVPAGYKIPDEWPLTDGAVTCLTCHFAGHVSGAIAGRPTEPAEAPHLLRGGVVGSRNAVCFRCHDPQRWAGRNPHRDAAQKRTGCEQCHAKTPVWGVDRANTVTFVADINIVCLACHNVHEHPGGVQHTVTLTADMPEPPELLPLGSGRRITCATCHNPHIDPPVGHRLRGIKEPVAFCARCHKL